MESGGISIPISTEVRLGRQECLATIPHDPNFISELRLAPIDEGYIVEFRSAFPPDWDFLNKRIFAALPTSVMIEVLSQAAMIAFKAMKIDGFPATLFIKRIRNRNSFFDYRDQPLDGEFTISRLRRTSKGVTGLLSDATLRYGQVPVMTLHSAGFIVFEEEPCNA